MSIDWTKPVQTRDGRKVTIYTTTAPSKYPVHGYIEGWEDPCCWTSGGRLFEDEESDEDLINAPEPKRVAWVNLYPDQHGSAYKTKAEADEFCAHNRIACVRVEWSPGQFDGEGTSRG